MSQNQAPSFDPQTPSDQALAAVAAAGPDSERLIQTWRDAGNAAALVEVAEEGSGPARKAARRALGVLRSRGIPIPEKRRLARLTSSTEETTEAWLVTPDSFFQIAIAIGRWPKARRGKVVFAQLNPNAGLLGLRIAELAQSGLKAEAQRLFGDRVHLVSIPVEWARSRIAAARAQTDELGAPPPLGLSSAADLIEPAPETAPPHPLDEIRIELTDEERTSLIESSARLHALPEFGAWLPFQSAVQEMLLEVGKHLTPGTQPAEEEMTRLMREAILSATDRYFSPEERARLTEAMKDAALGVLDRNGPSRVREVVATIQAIEQCGLITNPPREVPFLRAFFEKATQVLMAQNGGQLRIPIPRPQADAPEAAAPGGETAQAEGNP